MPMTQPPAHPYTCPCCGHLVFDEPPGSFDICPVCFWEDDLVQLADPTYWGGANRPSLVDCQRNYQRLGAMEERLVQYVRPAGLDEPLDGTWRPIDPALDNLEALASDMSPAPNDRTQLYYWRHNSKA